MASSIASYGFPRRLIAFSRASSIKFLLILLGQVTLPRVKERESHNEIDPLFAKNRCVVSIEYSNLKV